MTGTGGADVTGALLSSTNRIAQWWANDLTGAESDRLTTFDPFRIFGQESMYSFSGWDISPFNKGIDGQRDAFARGAADWAPRSVTVDNNVYYAHEVNYFIWGAAHAMAAKKGTEHGDSLTKGSMSRWILNYRFHTDVAYLNKPNDGTMFGRSAWAIAGWDYIETGVFRAPTDYRLPNASPNEIDVFLENEMSVQLGRHFPR
ncbi:MAG TPA: hypothetical protein DDZ51_04315 [Planctomycetaceae bacterium]|nr:hypothetical protein [Planctomycetaceae bacterium]